MFGHVLLLLAVFGLLTSTVYLGIVAVAALHFRSRVRKPNADVIPNLPSVTLLKPLHGMEPRLRQNLESFFRQSYRNYEIIFGARSAQDPALAVVEDLRRAYPSVPAKIVISGEPQWPNAKVCNLHKMLSAASHEYLIISDSDVKVPPDYILQVLPPLLHREIGMVTCLYRGVPTRGLWARLEALGMSVEMTSGVLAADMLEGMKFALGPTMAVRRDTLDAIGGFAALADYFADDFILGNRIAEAGYKVVLSNCIVEHLVINESIATSLHHQLRWAKSTRRSRPKGHFGTGLTFAVPFGVLGLIGALLGRAPALGFALLGAAILNRIIQSWLVGWGVVRDRQARSWAWLYPLRDLLGFCFWFGSYFGGRRTTWRGDRYVLQTGGRMVREIPLASAVGSEHIPA